MSIISQNNTDEVALLDCIQRFFPDTMSENFCSGVMVQRKREFRPLPFSDISRALFFRIGQVRDFDKRTIAGKRILFRQRSCVYAIKPTVRTGSHSLCILMDAMMASLQEILKLSNEQIAAFTADFENRLPKY